MKCPKCQYLGFETGDRCKNCGYDFSLVVPPEPLIPAPELLLRPHVDQSSDLQPRVDWANVARMRPPDNVSTAGRARSVDIGQPTIVRVGTAPAGPDEAEPGAAESGPTEPDETVLPLFSNPDLMADPEAGHHPLVRLPSSPRPPVAVRRAPETPRLKTPERITRSRPGPEPRLFFADQVDGPMIDAPLQDQYSPEPAEAIERPTRAAVVHTGVESCPPGARALAAAIDLSILGAIDVLVLYLTLRVAALSASAWGQLPPWPLAAFFVMLATAYFTAFAALGGQTIGKMVARIRVVTDDGGVLPPAVAVQRTLASLMSLATLGASFVPALVGARRAVHDRLTRTRVVALPAP